MRDERRVDAEKRLAKTTFQTSNIEQSKGEISLKPGNRNHNSWDDQHFGKDIKFKRIMLSSISKYGRCSRGDRVNKNEDI